MKKIMHIFLSCKKKQGTTLIECVLYCAIVFLLTTITFSWLLKTQTTLKKQELTNNALIGDMIIRDVITQAVRQAPGNAKLWKKKSDNEIIWQQNNGDIGLSCEKGQLIRSEGTFSEVLQQWQTRTKSIVGSDIKKFTANLRTQEKYGERWITQAIIQCNDTQWTIALMNGAA